MGLFLPLSFFAAAIGWMLAERQSFFIARISGSKEIEALLTGPDFQGRVRKIISHYGLFRDGNCPVSWRCVFI